MSIVDSGHNFAAAGEKVQDLDCRGLTRFPGQHLTEKDIPVPGALDPAGGHIVLAVSAHMDETIAPDMGLE